MQELSQAVQGQGEATELFCFGKSSVAAGAVEIHSPSRICGFWSRGAAPEEETRHGQVQVEMETSGDAKPVLTNGANVCEMVLTFFCMNQVVFALLYCGSFQHCVQIKEKMPREDVEWILSPPPFTLRGQHFLPNASFKLSHQGTLEQTGQPPTLQGLRMLHFFALPALEGLPGTALHVCRRFGGGHCSCWAFQHCTKAGQGRWSFLSPTGLGEQCCHP